MLETIKDKTPKVSEKAFIADGAKLIGDVEIEEGVSIWYNAVLRGDVNYIKIGKNSNVQDCSSVHGDYDCPVVLGENVTVGHNAVVHGCTVEDNCLIGMGAVVQNGAYVGEGSIIGAGAVVKNNMVIPKNSMVLGIPAKVVKENIDKLEANKKHALNYRELWEDMYK